jgi:hypothetical protein
MHPPSAYLRRISAAPKVVCSLAHTRSILPRDRSELARVASFVAFPILLLAFLTALLLALLWFLRGSLGLRSLVLASRPWCLLLRLGRTLLRLPWLLRLTLSLWFLRRSLGLRSFLLALRPWCLLLTLGRTLLWLLPLRLCCRAALLRKCLGSAGPLSVCASLLRRLSARGRWRRRRGRALRSLRLIALLHYGVLRLVTVVLALKRLLLLHARIASP